MQTQQTTADDARVKRGNNDDREYETFLADFGKRFLATIQDGPLFTTDAAGLWDAYLGSFEPIERQFHNCNACRHFIERFGGLVAISETGRTYSVLWASASIPEPYTNAFAALFRLVTRAKVTGVFLSSLPVLGQPETGEWRHLSVCLPGAITGKKSTLQTDYQAMAEKREDHATVLRALIEFPASAIDQALTLLKSDALYRSEKVLGQAQWLRDLHTAFDEAKGAGRTNVAWLAVAKAPTGFCHPRSSMIGTLLEDIVAGLDFGDVSRKFAAKMHPLQYQRPQAAPSAGNIAQAEKIIAELGAAGSLARRYARLDEVEKIWSPAEHMEPSDEGVFGHLKPKGTEPAAPMSVPAQAITWEKFARVVLPDATAIEVRVPGSGNFAALVTAENPDAPPILQWDLPEKRNPVSWYLYNGGSMASRWGLAAGSWARVNAVCLQPSMWAGGNFEHQGRGALLVIDGAKDSGAAGCGNALFPETLKAELRGVRSTIEAYSRSAKLGGTDTASANGLKLGKGGGGAHVRVTLSNGTRMEYSIDRWD